MECREISFIACARIALCSTSLCSKYIILLIACSMSTFFDEQRLSDDWVTFWVDQAWRVVNGMPRNLIYCMCWYCTLQHFLVFKIHYLTHRLLNVNIFRWAEVVRWLSNILSWSGVTSCQWNAEKSHLLHVLVLHFAALPCVQNTWSYSLLAQCQHFSMSRGCQMIE